MSLAWPPRPELWPEIMTDVEVCQYLRLDLQHPDPSSAKRSLRFIRRTQGLPDLGRIGSKVLFRRAAVDAWLVTRETKMVVKGSSDCPLARSHGKAYDLSVQTEVEPGCRARKHESSEPLTDQRAATANTVR